jgi:dihydroaeruginoic acid synthetase
MTNPSAVDAGRVAALASLAWCAALGLDEVPEDGNFFLLGGDSMTAVMVAAEVGSALGTEISLDDLLQAPSFAAFVERVRLAAEPA